MIPYFFTNLQITYLMDTVYLNYLYPVDGNCFTFATSADHRPYPCCLHTVCTIIQTKFSIDPVTYDKVCQ